MRHVHAYSAVGFLTIPAACWAQWCPPVWQDADGGLAPGSIPDPIVLDFIDFDLDGPSGPLDQQLFVAGAFRTQVGPPAEDIGRWNGFGWIPAANVTYHRPGGAVFDLAVGPDPADPGGPPVLFAGGQISFIDDVPVTGVAKWDGRTWEALAPLEYQVVNGMALHDPDGPGGPAPPILVVGGQLIDGQGNRRSVVFWDGASWTTPVQPPEITRHSMVWDVVSIDLDGGGPAPPALFLSLWNSAIVVEYVEGQWITRPGARGETLEVVDLDGTASQPPSLYSGGDGVSRLEPDRSWTNLGGPVEVRSLASWDPDGSGPAEPLLVAGGGTGVHAWDGTAWTTLTDLGKFNTAYAVHSFDDDGLGPRTPILFVGGQLYTVDGMAVSGVAMYGCNPPLSPCIGDANLDRRVNFDDATTVIGDWGRTNTPADTDRDGIVGMRDILSVLYSWNADCTVPTPQSAGSVGQIATSDFNADGIVNMDDVIARLAAGASLPAPE